VLTTSRAAPLQNGTALTGLLPGLPWRRPILRRVGVVGVGQLPALGVGTALRSWTPDPAGSALVVVLSVAYLLVVRRVRRGGTAWPAARTAAWLLAGVGSLAVTTNGFVGAYSSTLLWVHVLQVVLLLLVVPMLLALGQPAGLVRQWRRARGAPAPAGPGSTPRRLLNAAASPLVGPALVPVVLGLVLFTGVLPATLTSWAAHDIAEVGLLAVGLLVTLPLAGIGAASSLAVALATFVGFVELLLDAVPGFLMRTRTDLLAPAWAASLGRRWGPHPLQDQQTAGAILWSLGEVLDLPFLALLVVQWIRADEREARTVDGQLDAQLDAQPPTDSPGAVGSSKPASAAGRELQRPWWETDASVLGSERARNLQRPRRQSPRR